jgi:S-DNA-T family DNA segregation ATPase FtsK/SpoIIIE
MGDMLLSHNRDTRFQCAFLDTPEVEAICDWIESKRLDTWPLPEFVGEMEMVNQVIFQTRDPL